MKKLSILFLSIIMAAGCSSDDDNESTTDPDEGRTAVNFTSLEAEYGCVNTVETTEIALMDRFAVIESQAEFDMRVTGSCMPTIDFDTYALVIGKQNLPSGLDSIDYEVGQVNVSGNYVLTVTFNLNQTLVVPNVTYHALIPKLDAGQEVTVEILENAGP